jgi:DNA repair ATPase RecN
VCLPKTLQQWVAQAQKHEQAQTHEAREPFDATTISKPDPYEAGVQLVEFGALDEAQSVWGAAAEAGDTEAAFNRINGIASKAEGAVLAAYDTVGAAAAAIEQASTIAATAAPLLASYSEPLRRLEPAVRRLAETTDTHEVDALVTLIDRLPRLVNTMDDDVMPLLDRLDQSGPDLNQLLDSVSDLNRMAGRIPKVFRRRQGSDERSS